MDENKRTLLQLLSLVLEDKAIDKNIEYNDELFQLADAHVVLPMLYPYLADENISDDLKSKIKNSTATCVNQFYALLNKSVYYTNLLEENGIETVVLKGAGLASNYVYPELRKSGDIDILLLDRADFDRAADILEEEGLIREEKQEFTHQLVFVDKFGLEIELHLTMHEIVDNKRVNDYLDEFHTRLKGQKKYENVLGANIPVLRDGYQAVSMILHMLTHFTRSGFGLKLLCDWVVFWNRGIDENEQNIYRQVIADCGLAGFSDMITATCEKYLGLIKAFYISGKCDDSTCRIFIEEIMEAEEFGKTSTDRMVTLRGTGVGDYVREFHHQMHINFPTAGKIIVFWPVLWVFTLVKFLINNKRVRRTSLKNIIKTTNKRSKITDKIDLFHKIK